MNKTKIIKSVEGTKIIISNSDYKLLSKFKWHDRYSPWNKTIYFATYLSPINKFIYNNGGKDITIHRLILGLKRGDKRIGDHINMDTVDNRRENLRIVTSQESNMNRKVHRNNKCGYKGVRYRYGSWRACLQYKYKKIEIGKFSSAVEAAKAYNEYVIKLFDNKAWINKI